MVSERRGSLEGAGKASIFFPIIISFNIKCTDSLLNTFFQLNIPHKAGQRCIMIWLP